jgi:hypothetical protein
MDDDFVNIVALIRKNLPQGHFGLVVIGFGRTVALCPVGKVIKKCPHYTVMLLATSVVHKENVLTVLRRKSDGIGKTDSVGRESPCAGVVNRVVRTERDTRHPCVTDSGFLSAKWATACPVLVHCLFAVVYVVVYFAHNFKKYSLFQGQSQPLNVTLFIFLPFAFKLQKDMHKKISSN